VREFHLAESSETFGLAFLRDLAAIPDLLVLEGVSILQQPFAGEGGIPWHYHLERLTVNLDGSSVCQPIDRILGPSLRRLDLNLADCPYDFNFGDAPTFASDALPNLVDLRVTFRRYFHGIESPALALLDHCGPRLRTLHLRSTASVGVTVISLRDVARLCPKLRILSCNFAGFAPGRQQLSNVDSPWRRLSLDLLLLSDPTWDASVLPAQAREWAHAVQMCCPSRVGLACYEGIEATDDERAQAHRAVAVLRDVGWRGVAEDRLGRPIGV
jgi:hypothetical protein